jgi:hypothetical protein
MPLARSSDRFRADFEGIYFRMKDGRKGVTCLVSYAALDDYVCGTLTRRERVSLFKENRSMIERVASSKYDAGGGEPNGSIRVETRDLNPDQFCATAGSGHEEAA